MTTTPASAANNPPQRNRRPHSRADVATLVVGLTLALAMISWTSVQVAMHVMRDRTVDQRDLPAEQHTH
ncbi:MAG: hypothetical protein C0503_01060 [Gemmatimonas sp.]|nr:hypothetical protein [Gemmatimonas sp.]